ncbi:MAG: hypothetical protein JSV85_06855 [Candidatus Bathyarchaeota archaeon]|nr:MAG: hypothetical protein JSV85_06855 [Candidatus Bathyarchaeota archaeon]
MAALEHAMKKWASVDLWGKDSNKDTRRCPHLKDGHVSKEYCRNVCIVSDCDSAHGFERRRRILMAVATSSRISSVVREVASVAVKRIARTYNLESVLRREREAKILWALNYGVSSTIEIANFIYPDEQVAIGSPTYISVEETLTQMNHKGLVERFGIMMWRKTSS